ncbi:hypothetical protein TNCT_325321 [Trichonephila clavata]|uniref:Uncharacterized protein n=1 Tax=Trichonephila clavata TaxID=2740835 RepID=A0A8X6FXN7_TRICU|nr:hypothetical protein TNCT_325321 [Trichonephila clavata]
MFALKISRFKSPKKLFILPIYNDLLFIGYRRLDEDLLRIIRPSYYNCGEVGKLARFDKGRIKIGFKLRKFHFVLRSNSNFDPFVSNYLMKTYLTPFLTNSYEIKGCTD